MTRDNDDFIAQLEDYLEAFDGATPLPDRVRDAIRAELPSARQVRPWPGVVTLSIMLSNASAGARLGLATAAVVAAVVLGAAFLNTNGPRVPAGGGPTPTPRATVAPSPSPTASARAAAQPLELGQASYVACASTEVAKSCLPAGTYQLSGGSGVWPVTVTVDVPAGWFEWNPGTGWDAILVDHGRGASGWGVEFTTVAEVARDPCDQTKGMIPAAQVDTAQKLAAAIASWPKFSATPTQPITIDGHSGLTFQLTSTDTGPCDTSQGLAWQTASGAAVDAYPMISSVGAHAAATVDIVDTGNGLLVLRSTDFPQTSPAELGDGIKLDPTRHAGDQAELHAILDSVRLTPLPTP